MNNFSCILHIRRKIIRLTSCQRTIRTRLRRYRTRKELQDVLVCPWSKSLAKEQGLGKNYDNFWKNSLQNGKFGKRAWNHKNNQEGLLSRIRVKQNFLCRTIGDWWVGHFKVQWWAVFSDDPPLVLNRSLSGCEFLYEKTFKQKSTFCSCFRTHVLWSSQNLHQPFMQSSFLQARVAKKLTWYFFFGKKELISERKPLHYRGRICAFALLDDWCSPLGYFSISMRWHFVC